VSKKTWSTSSSIQPRNGSPVCFCWVRDALRKLAADERHRLRQSSRLSFEALRRGDATLSPDELIQGLRIWSSRSDTFSRCKRRARRARSVSRPSAGPPGHQGVHRGQIALGQSTVGVIPRNSISTRRHSQIPPVQSEQFCSDKCRPDLRRGLSARRPPYWP
jgi:hypothetical protein